MDNRKLSIIDHMKKAEEISRSIVKKKNLPSNKKEKILDVLPKYSAPFTSIDRVTLLIKNRLFHEAANHENPQLLVDFITKDIDTVLRQEKLIEHEYDYSPAYLRHYKLIGDIDLQLSPKYGIRRRFRDPDIVNIMGSEKDKDNGYYDETTPPDYPFRLEYNPNKSDITKIISLLRYLNEGDYNFGELIRITRIDVAIDYPQDINLALVSCNGTRKSFIALGEGGIQSVYFGTRRSKYYFRLYDKKRELKEQQKVDYQGDHLYRIELEFKEGFTVEEYKTVLPNIFNKLSFYQFPFNTGEPDLDFFVYYCKDFGLEAGLKKLDKQKRYRMRNKLKEYEFTPLVHPANIFEQQFPQIWQKFLNELEYYFFSKEGELNI